MGDVQAKGVQVLQKLIIEHHVFHQQGKDLVLADLEVELLYKAELLQKVDYVQRDVGYYLVALDSLDEQVQGVQGFELFHNSFYLSTSIFNARKVYFEHKGEVLIAVEVAKADEIILGALDEGDDKSFDIFVYFQKV